MATDEKPEASRALKKARKNFKDFRYLLGSGILLAISIIITCSVLIARNTRSVGIQVVVTLVLNTIILIALSFMLDHSRRLKISKEKLEQLLDVEIPRMYVVGLAIFAVGNLVLAIVTGVVPPKGVPWVDKRWPKVASSTSSRVSDGGRGLNFSTSLLALILMEATAVICDLFAIWSLLRGKDWIRKAIVETRLVRNGTPA